MCLENNSAYFLVMIVELVPGLLVRRLHERLVDLSCCVTAGLLDGGQEGLGLCRLCALLRLLLAPAVDGFELSGCVEVVKLGTELHDAVQASEM